MTGKRFQVFVLPDDVAEWDDRTHFAFLQEHQFLYQSILDDLRSRGLEDSDEYRHYVEQFRLVEQCLARDFNRRYHQG